MKKILICFVLLLFSFNLLAFEFGDGMTKSTESTDTLSIRIISEDDFGNDEVEWLYGPKDRLFVVLNETKRTISLAYVFGQPFKTYAFKTNAQAKKFINNLYPDVKCLTSAGLKKCNKTNQLKPEELEEQ